MMSRPLYLPIALLAIGLATFVSCDAPSADSTPPPSSAATDTNAASAEHSPDNGEWCHGHGLPESHCTRCHPELIDSFQDAGDWCQEHQFPESACPICNPMSPPGESNDSAESGPSDIPGVLPGTVVSFRRSDHESVTGIEFTTARPATTQAALHVPAHIQFNQNNIAEIRTSVPGIIHTIHVDLGDRVDAGDPLFELESARVGELQSELLSAAQDVETARANLTRQQELRDRGLAATRVVEEAQRTLQEAQSRQANLQSSLRLAGANRDQNAQGRYVLRAPIDGTIVRRPAVRGLFSLNETSLATIADTSTMWAIIDLPEHRAYSINLGQTVSLHVQGLSDPVNAFINWISPEIDPRTRSISVRADVDNPHQSLRANQFAQASIQAPSDQPLITLPRQSLQRIEDTYVIFVRRRANLYEPRRVELHRFQDQQALISGPLEVGEEVVTTGAFLLKTELVPDSIGAGCCEVE